MPYLLLLLAIICLLAIALRRPLLARLLKLPPPRYAVAVDRAIPVRMADGVKLMTDHYWPKGRGDFPTILIRTPYGRGREVSFFGGYPMSELPGQRFAERGYHVIVQGVRGRYDSEGEFDPHINEAADGGDTVQWISEQPWFDGRLAVWGPSYLGYTAWATALSISSPLLAIVPIMTSSENHSVTHPNGVFGLETRLRWSQGLAMTEQLHEQSWMKQLRSRFSSSSEQELQRAFMHLPLQVADEMAAGRPIQFFRQMLEHVSSHDRYWTASDHSRSVGQLEAPAHLIGGWYDYYLPGLLRDYAALKKAGRVPHLTIGPWNHANAAGLMTGLQEGIKWFDAQFKVQGEASRRQPVSIYVMGADEWREMEEFPPPSNSVYVYLESGGT